MNTPIDHGCDTVTAFLIAPPNDEIACELASVLSPVAIGSRLRRHAILITPLQFSLVKALLQADGNRFRSLRAWYSQPRVKSCSTSGFYGCKRVIRKGWATARWNGCRTECVLTEAGRAVAEERVPLRFIGSRRIRWRGKKYPY